MITDPLNFVKKFIIGCFLLLVGFLTYIILKYIYNAIIGSFGTSGWDSVVVGLIVLIPAVTFIAVVAKVFLYMRDRTQPARIASRPRQGGFKLPWQ